MLQGILFLVVIGVIYFLYAKHLRKQSAQPAVSAALSVAGDPDDRANLVRELGPEWGPLYDAAVTGNIGVLLGAIGAARGAWPRYHRLCGLGGEVPVGTAMSWVQANGSPEMELVAAEACMAEGWRVRGHGGADSVSRAEWQQFDEWQQRARERLLRVTALDPANPTPWALLVSVARNISLSDEEKLRFGREALARYPDHYGAVDVLLDGFAPHWHDDENAGLALARDLARSAPDNTLVAGCIIEAYSGKWHHAYYFGKGDKAFAPVLRQPEVQQELAWSFQRAMGHADNEWSAGWLATAAAVLARAGMRELSAAAFQRLGARAECFAPWRYIAKTAKLKDENACLEALRGWAYGTRNHPCRDIA
ncbi:MAG: hypothetical protein JW940_30460 [Polyangiaceae bacterium]|nr:hypothetical protein [Polyangiaceae bacterium]